MTSRAVLRLVQPAMGGNEGVCAACGERIIYRAREKPKVVICNVYENGMWDRVDQYHEDHYDGRHGDVMV